MTTPAVTSDITGEFAAQLDSLSRTRDTLAKAGASDPIVKQIGAHLDSLRVLLKALTMAGTPSSNPTTDRGVAVDASGKHDPNALLRAGFGL